MELTGTVRVSLACYNTADDVDTLVAALSQLHDQSRAEATDILGLNSTVRSRPANLPKIFAAEPFYDENKLRLLRTTLLHHKNWQDRYKGIMQLSWDLPSMPAEMKNDESRLSGCESNVWVHHYYNESDFTLHFAVESDARVIRGLSVIVLSLMNGRTAQELLDCDINTLFGELELANHLSPSRGNGLRAIVAEILGVARHYL